MPIQDHNDSILSDSGDNVLPDSLPSDESKQPATAPVKGEGGVFTFHFIVQNSIILVKLFYLEFEQLDPDDPCIFYILMSL